MTTGVHRLNNCVHILALLTCLLFSACAEDVVTVFSQEERAEVEAAVRAARSIDSLTILQSQYEKDNNVLGNIVTLRELGRKYRNESRFVDAVDIHGRGLALAEQYSDTLEWIKALNNLGTDYRRLGNLGEAHDCHFKAGLLSKEFSDTSYNAVKNHAGSLNGLGNIYMSIGDYERADSVFRQALACEKKLNSITGQAINYSNIGGIFEHAGQLDSAWVYYRQSMACNQEAGNTLGMSLCHTSFGNLYEAEGRNAEAAAEHEAAYLLMKDSRDEWHMLNSLVALGGIYIKTGEFAKASGALSSALKVAEKINSPSHVKDILALYSKYYEARGDYKAALVAYEKSVAKSREILNAETVGRINSNSFEMERAEMNRQRSDLNQELEHQQLSRIRERYWLLFVLAVLAIMAATAFYSLSYRAKSLKKVRQISSFRDSFFNNITHESRTPLTVILGLSRDLQNGTSTPAEVVEKAKSIERQGNNVLRIVNQILDVSKIKSTVGKVDWQNSDITSFLSMIVESYKTYAASRNIGLEFVNESGESIVMDFVPDYASKLVNNLLSNAFKYTPDGGKIDVKVWRDGKNAFLDVADNGIGMSKEETIHVLEPYYQASNRIHGAGTGIGLTLVKQIVDSAKGSVSLESAPGEGTVFHISVPVHNESASTLPEEQMVNEPMIPDSEYTIPTPVSTDEVNDDERRILIVEDNRDIAAYVGSKLADKYSVYYAHDGEEGLERTLALTPDLVITDWMMPRMDGIELCRKIRENDIVSHIPVVMLTAKVFEDDRVEGVKAGVDAYLTKPFYSEELCAVVKNLMESRRMLREKYLQGQEKKDEVQKPASEFMDNLLGLVKDRIDRNEKVDVPAIASELCMSSSQLYRKLKSVTGYSPADFFLRVRVNLAKEYIDSNPGSSFADIAARCGFNDYSSFVRAFKSVLGTTPSEYRKGDN